MHFFVLWIIQLISFVVSLYPKQDLIIAAAGHFQERRGEFLLWDCGPTWPLPSLERQKLSGKASQSVHLFTHSWRFITANSRLIRRSLLLELQQLSSHLQAERIVTLGQSVCAEWPQDMAFLQCASFFVLAVTPAETRPDFFALPCNLFSHLVWHLAGRENHCDVSEGQETLCSEKIPTLCTLLLWDFCSNCSDLDNCVGSMDTSVCG